MGNHGLGSGTRESSCSLGEPPSICDSFFPMCTMGLGVGGDHSSELVLLFFWLEVLSLSLSPLAVYQKILEQ